MIDVHTHILSWTFVDGCFGKDYMIGGYREALDFLAIGSSPEFGIMGFQGGDIDFDEVKSMFLHGEASAEIDKLVLLPKIGSWEENDERSGPIFESNRHH
jgi:hypothetical protein